MNILLIPDKFKGSLSAQEVITAIKEGINAYDPSFTIETAVVSDGGDGFLNAIAQFHNTLKVELPSFDSLGRKITSYYLIDNAHKNAYVELANTSGLTLLKPQERNPLQTSTYGTGLQIKSAIEKGAKKVYIGLGGSATNDAGIGIASALGYIFLNREKKVIYPKGENLDKITYIQRPSNPIYKGVSFYAINDVENPLFGTSGAAHVYGKQKGATDEIIDYLDKGLQNLDKCVIKNLALENAAIKGSGAAGGAAYGLKTFLNASFINGTDFMLGQARIEAKLGNNKIDLVITGEGSLDDQTMHGKLIKGIASLGNTYDVPVLAVCGKDNLVKFDKFDLGLTAILEIADTTKSLAYNMKHASQLTTQAIIKYFNSNF